MGNCINKFIYYLIRTLRIFYLRDETHVFWGIISKFNIK